MNYVFYSRFLKIISYLLLILFLCLFNCRFSGYSLLKPTLPDVYYGQDASLEKFLTANVVFLNKKVTIKLIRNNESHSVQITHYRLIKIMNEQGYHYANVRIPFDKNSPIKKIEARTILPDGSFYPLKKNQLFDTDAFPEYIFYSDQHEKRFSMPNVQPECLIEYSWVQEFNHTHFGYSWEFQEQEPVIKSSFHLICPDNDRPNMKIFPWRFEVDSVFQINNEQSHYQWTMHQLPPLIPEVSMPNGLDEVPHVRISSSLFRSWQDVHDWYAELIPSHSKLSPIIHNQINAIKTQFSDENERLKAIYQFVRDNIRYIAIEIGEGEYQPQSPEHVIQNRYGDCKDMTALMVAMASAMGIESHFVLLSNWYHGKNDTSFISPNNFNHVIAASTLKDGTLFFMDPTYKTTPFRQLPWSDQNRLGLLITPGEKYQFVKIQNKNAWRNESNREWSIYIDKEGWVAGTLKLTLTGNFASDLRAELLKINPNLLEIWMRRHLSNIFQDILFYDTNIEFLNDYDHDLYITGRFHSRELVINNANLYYFQPGKLSGFNLLKVFQELHREYSIQLKYPFSISDIIYIQFPEQWDEISQMEKMVVPNPYGNYGWQLVDFAPGNIQYKRKFVMNRSMISPNEYSKFLDLLRKVNRHDKAFLLFDSTKKER